MTRERERARERGREEKKVGGCFRKNVIKAENAEAAMTSRQVPQRLSDIEQPPT